jgi:hypothetical protein
LLKLTLSPEGSKGFDKQGTSDSVHLLGCISPEYHCQGLIAQLGPGRLSNVPNVSCSSGVSISNLARTGFSFETIPPGK